MASRVPPSTIERILLRSAHDAEFRQALLADTDAALAAEFGREVLASARLHFIERPADTVIVVLSDSIAAGGELADDQLEAVAGGTCGDSQCGDTECVQTFVCGIATECAYTTPV